MGSGRGMGMGYCDGFRNWLSCLKCDQLCLEECPLQAGDIDELIRQMNLAEAHMADFFFGGISSPRGSA